MSDSTNDSPDFINRVLNKIIAPERTILLQLATEMYDQVYAEHLVRMRAIEQENLAAKYATRSDAVFGNAVIMEKHYAESDRYVNELNQIDAVIAAKIAEL